ncbi:hypothetical protein EJ08DRAFT_697811 [Tothia fuscella]|uniref:Uncharacterized protein n=1 Tax=Tothia fuscella TaxID=1048955 RepID=A0A9P4NQX8_9PEZI|nr:hypothetical protein EJ08DRAFT_697811 [Tothia fuscella]
MRIVATGKATQQQLENFQKHIDELTNHLPLELPYPRVSGNSAATFIRGLDQNERSTVKDSSLQTRVEAWHRHLSAAETLLLLHASTTGVQAREVILTNQDMKGADCSEAGTKDINLGVNEENGLRAGVEDTVMSVEEAATTLLALRNGVW